jgi:hypothetical protein
LFVSRKKRGTNKYPLNLDFSSRGSSLLIMPIAARGYRFFDIYKTNEYLQKYTSTTLPAGIPYPLRGPSAGMMCSAMLREGRLGYSILRNE